MHAGIWSRVTVAGRVTEHGRRRTSTDSDDGSSAAMLDDVTVKCELQQVPANTPPSLSSSSSSSVPADQAGKINIKQELDHSTSSCDKVVINVGQINKYVN